MRCEDAGVTGKGHQSGEWSKMAVSPLVITLDVSGQIG